MNKASLNYGAFYVGWPALMTRYAQPECLSFTNIDSVKTQMQKSPD
ncbi:hypothetical protein SOHN41_02462 [Shewanella sp. HN-41]|nr:hypothetical protein SOHN41_02462 [Shewanella sp. HN-41]